MSRSLESYYIRTERPVLFRPTIVEQHPYRPQKKEALDTFAARASRRMDERAVFAVSSG
jgi:hypothetical protein